MKRKCLIVIQNLSKSGSPLTFLHLIESLRENFIIDVCVTSALDKTVDFYYADKYKQIVNELFLLKIQTHSKINRLFPYFAYRDVLKIIKKHRYDVVISNAFEIASLLNYKKIKTKNVFYSLDKILVNSKYKVVNYRKNKMLLRLRKVDLFLSLTKSCLVEGLNVNSKNVEILTDYPDIEIINTRKEFSNDGKIYIGMIGYFCPKKNQIFALEILRELIKNSVDCKLLLMGYHFSNDLIYFNQMKAFIENYHLSENVIFLDKDFDKIAFFNKIDVLLAPSLYEGLGLVAMESQCRATPCILSTNFPEDAQIGLALFESLNNIQGWVDKIKNIKKLSLSKIDLKSDLKFIFNQTSQKAFTRIFAKEESIR